MLLCAILPTAVKMPYSTASKKTQAYRSNDKIFLPGKRTMKKIYYKNPRILETDYWPLEYVRLYLKLI